MSLTWKSFPSLLVAGLGTATLCFATAPNVPADNSAVNERDRQAHELTAESQGLSEQETEVTRKIRVALTEDDSLSTYAKNVKIITQGGTVTLKGPVNSAKEKTVVQRKAEQFAQHYPVINQLTVASNSNSK